MPTTHVEPGNGPLLQDIANTLWKSRKVVVITGAGISTNSGIPDFRSENGLYSLIQAQFEAAQQAAGSDADVSDAPIEQRPAKRQRRAYDGSDRGSEIHEVPFPGLRNAPAKVLDTTKVQEGPREEQLSVSEPDGALPSASSVSRPGHDGPQPPLGTATMRQGLAPAAGGSSRPDSPGRLPGPDSCPREVHAGHTNSEPVEPTAPFPSSPPSLTLGTPRPPRAHLLDSLPGSSSPLSSPPHVVFDPYQESTDYSSSQDTESSRSQSEEPSSVSTPLLSSQTSFASFSRATLPLMKGRDLFDAQIWSCPIKTSVFYTFVSTLREKVRSAEPTDSHRFISVLRDSRKLVRCYTQNIDQLEERVGLSTSLSLGVGSRYRFSVRAGRNSGAAKGSKSAEVLSDASQGASQQEEDHQDVSQDRERLQDIAIDGVAANANTLPPLRPSPTNTAPLPAPENPPSSTPSYPSATSAPAAPNRGVECVFLHGSLAELRCFVCARTASWDEDTRLAATLAGRQPTCPHCAGATAAREERGKRALGVGKLRPDIVLYGEEHPHAHLISPLIQHDLSLGPDMLLILGTSMRVHGLKVLVREFAKAVHDRGGKVVFVNFTKPPESVWADIIDYWVQWDCDAWVGDLQQRKPALWLPPGTVLPEEEKPKPSKLSRRQSAADPGKRKDGAEKASKKAKDGDGPASAPNTEADGLSVQDRHGKDEQPGSQEMVPPLLPTPPKSAPKKPAKIPREPKLNPDAKRPSAIRDHKLNGAYLVLKIMEDLRRITGAGPAQPVVPPPNPKPSRPKSRKPRSSAPAAQGFQGTPLESGSAVGGQDTLEPQLPPAVQPSSPLLDALTTRSYEGVVPNSDSSISAAVKTRKRKQAVAWRMIHGVETRISLNHGPDPGPHFPSLPHTTALLRPSPVPESLRLPPPTPTTPREPPQHESIVSIPPKHPSAPSSATSALEQAINAGFRETDRLIAKVHEEALLSRPATPSQQQLLRLPPLNTVLEPQEHPHHQPQLYHRHQLSHHSHGYLGNGEQHQHPLPKLAPLEPKVVSPGPRKGISSNVGSPVVPRFGSAGNAYGYGHGQGHNPFFLADPLVGWLGYPPAGVRLGYQGERPQRAHEQQPHHHYRHQRTVQQPQYQPQAQQQGLGLDTGAGAGTGGGADVSLGQEHSPPQKHHQDSCPGLGQQHPQQPPDHSLGPVQAQLHQQQQPHQLPGHGLMPDVNQEGYHPDGQGQGQAPALGVGFGVGPHHHHPVQVHVQSEGRGADGMELALEQHHHHHHHHHHQGGVDTGSAAWCPDEQLRKEQEVALMLSSLRGSATAGAGEFY